LIAAYQDIKIRAVDDIVWIPAIVGSILAFYLLYPNVSLLALKIGMMTAFALAFSFLGQIAAADVIALVVVFADPYAFSMLPIFFATLAFLIGHVLYNRLKGIPRKTTIPVEQFLKEQNWIPLATLKDGKRTEIDEGLDSARDRVEENHEPGSMIEVEYGIPTVAYLGLGYFAYLVYILVFNQGAFLLPL